MALGTPDFKVLYVSAYFQSQKQLKERQIGDLEEQKLRVNLEITEIVSKLSIVLDTKEKAKLEVRFQELLTEKFRTWDLIIVGMASPYSTYFKNSSK